jgi:hypothetical protein
VTAALGQQRLARAHCDLDDWDFDPRYTEGVCPICGWQPEGAAATPRPQWLAWTEKVQWDIVGLMVLAVVLLVMAVLVGRAAGITLTPKS